MSNGSRTTAKVTVRVNGKKRKVLIPAIACKEFPFGTVLELTYHDHKTWVIVEDRGPFVKGRKFDLAPRAQQDLGVHDGVVTVHYKVMGHLRRGYNWGHWPGLITRKTVLYK